MSRRTPTLQDREKARRLKKIWNEKKGDLGLTQITASAKLGIKQPTFSQFLNCVVPLNTDMILAFADLLGVTPIEIDPTLKNVNSLMAFRKATLETIDVPFIGSITGRSVMGRAAIQVENLEPGDNHVAVAVDDNTLAHHGIPKGSSIVLDLNAIPAVQGRKVVISERGVDGYRLYVFNGDTDSSYRVTDLHADNERRIRKNQVSAMHLVHSVQYA